MPGKRCPGRRVLHTRQGKGLHSSTSDREGLAALAAHKKRNAKNVAFFYYELLGDVHKYQAILAKTEWPSLAAGAVVA
ncbi:hypothetical protein CRV24_001150 [Beauveria bassiana]|nr:hypothetical protein CRV24_001150 [Beauveria bassiana]KAH8720270.1 hypothetical protein HC256_000668 [Beauveria bassiana]